MYNHLTCEKKGSNVDKLLLVLCKKHDWILKRTSWPNPSPMRGGWQVIRVGSWSADPQGHGIWVIFWLFLVKMKKKRKFFIKVWKNNHASYTNFNGIPNILVPNNLQFVCWICRYRRDKFFFYFCKSLDAAKRTNKTNFFLF